MLATMSHTKKAALVLLLYVLLVTAGSWTLLALSAHAQPAPAPAEEPAEAAPAAQPDADSDSGTAGGRGQPVSPPADDRDGLLTVVGKGDTAPFGGLLLKDQRYAELKHAELTMVDAEFRASQAERTQADLEKVLSACLEVEEQSFFGPSFWIGTAVGIVTAVAVGWLGYKILDEGD